MEYVYEMPAEMLEECAKKGSVERFEYDTFTYDEGDNKPLKKGAWVYLPYGYDPAKKYDILYLLHGGGVTEENAGEIIQALRPDLIDVMTGAEDVKGSKSPEIIAALAETAAING